jgi:hypothetical protein
MGFRDVAEILRGRITAVLQNLGVAYVRRIIERFRSE